MERPSWPDSRLIMDDPLLKMTIADQLTLLVFTMDNLDRIDSLIESTNWIQHRIAIDMNSEDGTKEKLCAALFDVHSIDRGVFVDELRNQYLSKPTTPWTLVLDSDEFLSDDAEEQISQLIDSAEENTIGFAIPRHNYFCRKKLFGSGFYPDHQLRLFRTNQIIYSAGHHKPPKPKNKSGIIKVLDPPSCLHIHHNNYPTVEEFLRRQLHYAITDIYDSDPQSFDFDDYMLKAISEFTDRYGNREDGSLSYVAALVMYWDEIVRGLIHWERSGYSGHLSEHVPNQVFVASELSNLIGQSTQSSDFTQQDIDNLHAAYLNSRSWRITAPLRWLNSLGRP